MLAVEAWAVEAGAWEGLVAMWAATGDTEACLKDLVGGEQVGVGSEAADAEAVMLGGGAQAVAGGEAAAMGVAAMVSVETEALEGEMAEEGAHSSG